MKVKELIKQLNIKQSDISELHKKITEKYQKGEKEATKVLEDFQSSKELKELYIYIIESKKRYHNTLKSDFYFLFKFSRPTDTNDIQSSKFLDLSKKILIFHQLFFITWNYDIESITNRFSGEAFEFRKNEVIYNTLNNFISTVNSSSNLPIKFPLIEDFEIDSFKMFLNQLRNLNENYDNLLKTYDLETERYVEEKRKVYDELDKKESDLRETIDHLETTVYNLKAEKSDLKWNLKKQVDYAEILKNEALKKDYIANPQFNNLYWGDNYPALKVLFGFLQANQIYKYSWSHFASQMSIGDLTIIQFYTGNINKRELGYLFSKIKPYFSLEFKNTNIHYLSFLKRKFSIDDKFIDDTYCKNNIRNYKKSKYSIKTKEELDFLCNKIGSRYF